MRICLIDVRVQNGNEIAFMIKPKFIGARSTRQLKIEEKQKKTTKFHTIYDCGTVAEVMVGGGGGSDRNLDESRRTAGGARTATVVC